MRNLRRTLIGIGLLSVFLGIMTVCGALLIVALFDTIMPSHNGASLVGLMLFAAASICFFGFFIGMRNRALVDLGAALHNLISGRMPAAIHYVATHGGGSGDGMQPLDDAEDIRSFLTSPGAAAIFDMPSMLLALVFLFFVHVWIGAVGLVALAGAVALCLASRRAGEQDLERLSDARSHRRLVADEHRRHSESIQSLGLTAPFLNRWVSIDRGVGAIRRRQDQRMADFDAMAATLRLLVVVLALIVGIWLSFDDRASIGVVVASAILLFQIFGTVERSIRGWNEYDAARSAWHRLQQLMPALETPTISTTLPAPHRLMECAQLVVAAPGTRHALVQNIGFRLEAGQALGIVGSAGSGKTVLARALVGTWKLSHGEIRLDGAALDQWDPQRLASHIGYMPQHIEFPSGTIGQNISRFDPDATPEEIIASARAAGLHDAILQLPAGYQTDIGRDGMSITPGMRQRIGLARALFRDPFVVVLDDPNSQTDADGDAALADAICAVRARKGIVIMVSYDHNMLQYVDHIMLMRNGSMGAFGPAERMLTRVELGAPQEQVDGDV